MLNKFIMKCVVKLDSSKLVLWLNDTIAMQSPHPHG